MAIDPSIYQGATLANPAGAFLQGMQLAQQQKAQQQQQQAAQQEQQLRGMQIQQAQRQQSDTDALDQAFASGLDREGILSRVPGHLRPTIQKQFTDADENALKVQHLRDETNAAEADYFGGLARTVKSHNYDLGAAMLALQHAKEAGYKQADDLWGQIKSNPDGIKPLVDGLIAQSPKFAQIEKEEAAQQETARHNTTTEAAAAQTQASLAANRTADNTRLDQQFEETKRHNVAVEAAARLRAGQSTDTQADAQAIADAIQSGDQPPDVKGLYRFAGPVRAELAKRGYDFTKASLDWQATQKHVASLNGAQQLRLNQSVNALPELLDSVDALASKWKGGRFPMLNKANLALAKGGAYGSDVASIASQLDAQIADVTADLGNVYMGGNSPTDHALGLAGQSLKGEWDEKVLHDMVTLAKKNVQIRRNSINSTGVAGASATNPYAPPATTPATTPPPATGAVPSYQDYLRSKGGK